MPENLLHIIAFDIPYPPNYGGVIDVFYKLKALHTAGIKIILHAFEYPGRNRDDELNKYCEQVHYYPRLTGIKTAFSTRPYIVAGRRSDALLERLLKDEHPILFEGLHSCYYISHPAIKNRFKIYRESNIEHRYYYNLFRVDKNLYKKCYFLLESMKLRIYQHILKHATLMLVVSQKDTDYLQRKFPDKQVEYLPSFHANEQMESLKGKGNYALYNGNIEVSENAHAVEWLLREVFNETDFPFIIAGMNPPDNILNLAESNPRVKVIANPDDAEMFDLIKKAHVNILITFQATGLKLKLLNTLYKGRFCLVNDKMLNGTGLDALCAIGNNSRELRTQLKNLFTLSFEESEIKKRQLLLQQNYDNSKNAEKLIRLVFNSN